jgi:hypothetical protein
MHEDDRLPLDAAGSIRKQLDTGAVALDEATVRRLCHDEGGIPRWRVVKAVGRAGPHPAVRHFLLERLADQREADLVRLVAASALTRDPADESGDALKAHQGSVNRWADDAAAGQRLVAHWQRRARVDGILREAGVGPSSDESFIQADRDDDLPPVPEAAMKTLAASGDPSLLDLSRHVKAALEECLGLSDDDHSNWLRAAAARLHECREPWDTYSDAVHVLVAEVPYHFGESLFGDEEDAAEEADPGEARFEANVRAALESLEGGWRPRGSRGEARIARAG